MNETSWDKEKGELRIHGKRHIAIEAEALCEHLDSLVGMKVGAVILNQHEFRLGKEDASRILQERPGASVQDVAKLVAELDRLSGVGIITLSISENPSARIICEIANPVVHETDGTARALIASYWCGVFSQLLGRPFETKHGTYDEATDVVKYYLEPRTNHP